jgi:hypothetical protein
MDTQSLQDLISTLTPERQTAAAEFIEFLRNRKPPFLTAVDEFVERHSELLRPLAG